VIHAAFAAEIARYPFALATCDSVKYVVAKFFEIMAMGTAVVTTPLMEDALGQLGFVRGEH